MSPEERDSGPQSCSFCGASPEQVERLWAAKGASICDRCIRSLAAEEAVYLPEDSSSNRLLGLWRRSVSDSASVSLQFEKGGILRSTTIDGAVVTTKLLSYSFNGSELAVVELVACGKHETSAVDVAGDVLTLRSNRGESVFKREESEVYNVRVTTEK